MVTWLQVKRFINFLFISLLWSYYITFFSIKSLLVAEYGYSSKVNEKCDVYSFGVVLIELVTGRKPIEAEFGESKDILNWVSNNLNSKESVMEIVDKNIGEMYREDAVKMLRVAILCTARQPGRRPTMRSVVQMIEDAEPCRLMGIVISKEVM